MKKDNLPAMPAKKITFLKNSKELLAFLKTIHVLLLILLILLSLPHITGSSSQSPETVAFNSIYQHCS
jgi:hypothetical protein